MLRIASSLAPGDSEGSCQATQRESPSTPAFLHTAKGQNINDMFLKCQNTTEVKWVYLWISKSNGEILKWRV